MSARGRRLPLLATMALAVVSCAADTHSSRHPPAVMRPVGLQPLGGRRTGPEARRAADEVERSLRARGLRFGTDGSLGALFAYLALHHQLIGPEKASPGDVVFFDLAGGSERDCTGHVGLIEEVAPDGRITFREWRGGGLRRSYLHPGEPRRRRDDRGRVMNSFLRPKRPNDPPSTRYYAGELLCAVAQVRAGEKLPATPNGVSRGS